MLLVFYRFFVYDQIDVDIYLRAMATSQIYYFPTVKNLPILSVAEQDLFARM